MRLASAGVPPTQRMAPTALLLALALGFSAPARSAPSDVRLLSSDPGSVRLVVDVPEIVLVPSSDRSLSSLVIPGYAGEGSSGEAPLPVRVITIAVPPTGPVSVAATGSAAEEREAIRLEAFAPPPRPASGRGLEAPTAPVEATSARARPLARLLEVSWMRDQRIARIAIAPATWDVRSRRLTVRHRVEVEVRFDAAQATTPATVTDAFEPLYRDLLVNYEQGRSWRKAARARGARELSARSASIAAVTAVPETSLYAGRPWVKIAIPATGFYRVGFDQLRRSALFDTCPPPQTPCGTARTGTPTDSLRLFTWPGVPVLPEGSYCDSCDYREVAIAFVESGVEGAVDGVFDKNDEYFYFFALGPSDWGDLYDPTMPETMFVNNPYETRNYVYLTIATSQQPVPGAPRRIGTEPGGFTDADTLVTPTPASFDARIHHELDVEYWPDATPITGRISGNTYSFGSEAWEKFFWASFTAGDPIEQTFDLPGLAGTSARVRLRAWGLSRLVEGISKSFGTFDHDLDVRVGSHALPRRSWNGQTPQTYDTTLAGMTEQGNRIELSVPVIPDPDPRFNHFDRVGLAWFDVFYPRRFEPVGDQLVFDSSPAGGTWLYRIGPFTAPAVDPPRVFDVTDPLAPIEILNTRYRALSASTFDLRFVRTESGRRRYRVVTDTTIARRPNEDVADAPASSLLNLRRLGEGSAGADFLLVYFDDFRVAADSLLAWRRTRLPAMLPKVAPFDAVSVPISAIYDQFSGGRTDPAAMRNFLRAAYTHWNPRPSYVTFLGDGSHDFKNIKGQAPPGMPGTLVPSYENGYDDNVERTFATDDWILNVDDPAVVVPDFYGGRIPAEDAQQAIQYVRDKLLPYERAAPLGEWRNRVMLIADDNEQGAEFDPINWGHLSQTARLDREGMPPELDRRYVYLHTYPDGPSQTKPGAKADIIRGIEEGTVLSNYIGHGSPFKLADESVFLDIDASALTNKTRPTVFVAASCDVGKFNDPSVKSLGENLVHNPMGGAVAVISATEVAFSNINANLNLELFRNIFRRDPATGWFETPLSKGLLAAKSGVTNNQKYQVMGDAAVRLVLPRYWVTAQLRDSLDNPATEAPRGATMRLVGSLLDRPGGSPLEYDGIVRLLVEDSAPVDTTPNCSEFSCVAYPFRAAPMFRGDVAVRGGAFSARFVVPMNAETGPRARARPYEELSAGPFVSDAVGSLAFTVLPGTLPTGDREGPHITLGFRGGATAVRPDALLRVDLFDESGILITGHTPQNGIIVTIDDDSNQRTDITSTFRYAADSYQSGTAFFQLPGLAPGPHRIRVSAADNLAAGIAAPDHRSSATIEFEVTDDPPLRVTRAVLFPNPTRSGGALGGGRFVVDAPGDSVNVLLRIYTVGGKLVRTLTSADGGLAQVQIPWDGLDAEGQRLAMGTYLFKAQVWPRDPGGASSSRRRAEAEGRLVIIGP